MEQGIEIVKQEAGKIMLWANGLAVNNQEEYKLAYDGIKGIKTVRSKWIAYWGPMKTKAHATWKEICGKEKEGTDILDKAELIAKKTAETWRLEAERKAEAEQRRLQAEADERARRERERLEKKAENLKTPEKKTAVLEQAAAVEAPVITITAPVEVEGVSVRKIWKARLVDMDKLIAAATPGSVAASFLEYSERAANSFARSTNGAVSVAGIEWYEDRTSSVRGEK
jgi:hypothetical protein